MTNLPTEPPQTHARSWTQALVASLTAGVASALLVAVLQPQSIFGLLLFLIAPLPVVIAGFSYHPLVALLAGLCGCLFLDVFVMQSLSLTYALVVAVPAWLVCDIGLRRGRYLSSLRDEAGFFTTGTVILAIASYVSALIVVGAIWISPSYEGFRAYLYKAFEETIKLQYDLDGKTDMMLPADGDFERLGRIYSRAIPSVMAMPFFIMIVLSGYLGAKVARTSQRLPRVWPDMRTLQIPNAGLALLVLAIGLIFVGGFAGLAGELLVMTLSLCFMLQGLAVIHHNFGRRTNLRWLLSASWALLIVFGFSAIAFALLGLADHFLDLRKLRSPTPLT